MYQVDRVFSPFHQFAEIDIILESLAKSSCKLTQAPFLAWSNIPFHGKMDTALTMLKKWEVLGYSGAWTSLVSHQGNAYHMDHT